MTVFRYYTSGDEVPRFLLAVCLWAEDASCVQHNHRSNGYSRCVEYHRSAALLKCFDISTVFKVVRNFQVIFNPPEALLESGDFVEVEVTATDALANRNQCKFQVAYMRKHWRFCFVHFLWRRVVVQSEASTVVGTPIQVFWFGSPDKPKPSLPSCVSELIPDCLTHRLATANHSIGQIQIKISGMTSRKVECMAHPKRDSVTRFFKGYHRPSRDRIVHFTTCINYVTLLSQNRMRFNVASISTTSIWNQHAQVRWKSNIESPSNDLGEVFIHREDETPKLFLNPTPSALI